MEKCRRLKNTKKIEMIEHNGQSLVIQTTMLDKSNCSTMISMVWS